MNVLVVVDMQVDFISGSLGSDMAQGIVQRVVDKVCAFEGTVIFTRDTHANNYLLTQEGRNLPVEHCIKGTAGWEICEELKPYAKRTVDKGTFGSLELAAVIGSLGDNIEKIELCGLCTDICVISNAMILKAAFPQSVVAVDSSCCAGVTQQSHNIAIEAMRAVQIVIE